MLWTASFASLLALYVLLNWLPTLLGDRGLAKPQASVVSILFNLGAGAGILILCDLLERRRRRWTVGVWYLGLAGSLVAFAMTGPGFAVSCSAGVRGRVLRQQRAAAALWPRAGLLCGNDPRRGRRRIGGSGPAWRDRRPAAGRRHAGPRRRGHRRGAGAVTDLPGGRREATVVLVGRPALAD
ncbi:MAG: hypothetical protein WDM85_02315 [Caulobacteraceae bacterium]